MKRAASVVRDHLVSFGTCFGKFSKTRKFRLHVTALDYLAPYAKVRFWHDFSLFGMAWNLKEPVVMIILDS